MTSKTKRQRSMRQQRHREKARLRKQDKPIREAGYGRQIEEVENVSVLGPVGQIMLGELRKANLKKLEADVDRREKHKTGQESGDR